MCIYIYVRVCVYIYIHILHICVRMAIYAKNDIYEMCLWPNTVSCLSIPYVSTGAYVLGQENITINITSHHQPLAVPSGN